MSKSSAEQEAKTPVVHWYIPLPEAISLPNSVFQSGNPDNQECNPALTDDLYVSLFPLQLSGDFPSPSLMDFSFDALRASVPGPDVRSAKTARAVTPLPSVECTVIEAVAVFPLGSEPSEENLSDAFDLVLERIRFLQRAYYMATKYPVSMVAREQLPDMLAMLSRKVSVEEDGYPGQVGMYIVSANTVRGYSIPKAMDSEQESAFGYALAAGDRPFDMYVDLRRDATVAYHKYGNYRDAVLTAASASEVFLDSLLTCMLWEENCIPEQAAQVFHGAFAISDRVKKEFAGRLRGDWALVGSGVLAKWYKDVMVLRNRVIHGGHRPTLEEAGKSLQGMQELETYAGDRLADALVLKTYPRTAFYMLGYPGLRRRGAENRRFRDFMKASFSDSWSANCMRFALATALERENLLGVLGAPDLGRSRLHIDFLADGGEVWVAWDKSVGQAALVQKDLAILSEAGQAHYVKLSAMNRQEDVTVEFEEFKTPALASEWQLEYHSMRMLPVSLV